MLSAMRAWLFKSATSTLRRVTIRASSFPCSARNAVQASITRPFDASAPGSSSAAFVFDRSSGDLYYDNGGGSEGYTLVAKLEGGVDLTSSDLKMS